MCELQKKLLAMALSPATAGLSKLLPIDLWPKLTSQRRRIFRLTLYQVTLAEQGRAIIDAALSGQITVDVGRDLSTALYAQAKIVELAELEERLKALEGHRDIAPWDHKPVQRLVNDQELLPMRSRTRRRKLK